MKTTIILRDDLYQILVENFGKKNLSSTINEFLANDLLRKQKKDFFGADKWLLKTDLSDLRDKHDRDF